MMIAALYVAPDGCYSGIDRVEVWDEIRDARLYVGPHPVVAHPPCQRWGRFWHGSTRKPHQFKLGDDGGCFAAALASVRKWGGVLEHPRDSRAWKVFGLTIPPRAGGWIGADVSGGFTCCVSQGHYGHFAGKPSWLYVNQGSVRSVYQDIPDDMLPNLIWGPCEQRLHPIALERYGYEKARRIGMMAMIGGKDKTKIRNATPPDFRDLLLFIARAAGGIIPLLLALSACVAQVPPPPVTVRCVGCSPPYPPYERPAPPVQPSAGLDAQQWATHHMHQGELAVCQ